jgi:hypothetical protein
LKTTLPHSEDPTFSRLTSHLLIDIVLPFQHYNNAPPADVTRSVDLIRAEQQRREIRGFDDPFDDIHVPQVEVTATWIPRSRFWPRKVAKCCFCGKPHLHGGGDDEAPDLGYRSSHCIDRPGGTYDLVLAPFPFLLPVGRRR